MAPLDVSPIIHGAQRIIDCISHALETPPSKSTADVLDSLPATHVRQKLNLPCAKDYLAITQRQGYPIGVVERCHGALDDLAQRTHETYARTLRRMATSGAELSDSTIDALCRTLEKLYHHKSVQIIQLVDKYHKKKLASEKHVPVTKSSKPTFNHKCTPLLEQYFECNAYPSGYDKASLAKRTGMTQRQIDVWFQNHRTRTKKDGRPLRRPLDEGLSAPLVANVMNDIILPQRVYSSVASADTEIGESDSDTLVLVGSNKQRCCTILDETPSQIPPYAFPALYRQRDKQDLMIPPVMWERKPSSFEGIDTPIDMDEFISSFASKLTLGARNSNAERRRKPKQGASGRRPLPWYEPKITVPATAPLEAFVRSQNTRLENPERHCASAQRRPHPYGARWSSIGEHDPYSKPCHRLRPGVKNNLRRRSSSSSTSYSSSGSSEDLSSGNELLTPPASPLIPPQFIAEKTIPFDIYGRVSDTP